LGPLYLCDVNNNPNIITEESADISSVNGIQEGSKSNDDVLGFYALSRTIQFFPKGLNKFFKNIKMITISSCQLKEIHQSDLKVFPDLVYFDLESNEIEVIEAGLFDFNPNLQLVGIQESKIIHIDPNVFDHLNKLSNFWFYSVPCVDQTISNSKEMVQEVLKIVTSNCSNSEFLSLDNQIKNLEIESKTLNSEDFNTKLESFEKSFNNSKFSKSQTLNYKLQNLKLATSTPQVQNVSISDVNLSNDLRNTTDLNASQNELQTTLSDIKSLITDYGSKLDQIPKIHDTLSTLGSTLEILKASHDQMSGSLTDLKTDIDMSIDAKLKLVESRLMNKIDEKLNKILEALNIGNLI